GAGIAQRLIEAQFSLAGLQAKWREFSFDQFCVGLGVNAKTAVERCRIAPGFVNTLSAHYAGNLLAADLPVIEVHNRGRIAARTQTMRALGGVECEVLECALAIEFEC